MTTSSNESPGADDDQQATASSPSSGTDNSAEVTSTGGMASGSEGSAGEAGFIDDSQLPEELRPDAEGLADRGADGDGQSLGQGEIGQTGQTGQLPEAAEQTPADQPDVSEPTA